MESRALCKASAALAPLRLNDRLSTLIVSQELLQTIRRISIHYVLVAYLRCRILYTLIILQRWILFFSRSIVHLVVVVVLS